jgi:hypothetical protein
VYDLSVLPSVQTDTGAHPAYYQWIPGIERQKLEADNSPPSIAEVKKVGAIPPPPPISS